MHVALSNLSSETANVAVKPKIASQNLPIILPNKPQNNNEPIVCEPQIISSNVKKKKKGSPEPTGQIFIKNRKLPVENEEIIVPDEFPRKEEKEKHLISTQEIDFSSYLFTPI
jgi:hypothetical protein